MNRSSRLAVEWRTKRSVVHQRVMVGRVARKLRFGSAAVTQRGAPEFSRRYDGGRVAIAHNLMEPYEIHFQAAEDVVSIPLGVIEGVRAYDTDRRTRLETRPGDLIFHPAGATVYVDAPRRVAEFFSFAIDPALRAEVAAEVGDVARIWDGPRSLHLRGSEAALGVAQTARRFMLGGGAAGKLAVQSLGILALTASLPRFASAAQPARGGLDEVRLRRVLDYVDAHAHGDVGLTELAALAGLSTFHFARAFKCATGLTPYRYVVERRLQLARGLLATTDESIAAIAFEAGFASQSHMTDTFRRRLGTTPGRYRQSL